MKKQNLIKNLEKIIGRIGIDVAQFAGALERFSRCVESELSTSREILDYVKQFCEKLLREEVQMGQGAN